MSWLDAFLTAITTVLTNGGAVPQQTGLNFLGCTVENNSTLRATDVAPVPVPIVVTSTMSSVGPNGSRYLVDTTSGVITVTLPTVLTDGYTLSFKDPVPKFGTNALTVTALSGQIEVPGTPGTYSSSITLGTNGISLSLSWSATYSKWLVTEYTT